ncbi:M48 family metalloprotease [Thiothrix eikelboomii]|uniref:M48 family metalloprotease n=1 Tax=Thiothrix eikelboomii TaxID=92487 RepID=UPI003BAEDF9D
MLNQFALFLALFLMTSLTTLTAPLSYATDLNLNLPDIELPEVMANSGSLGTAQEQQAGLALLRELRRRRPMIEDPELVDWINQLGQRLGSRSPNRNPLYFMIEKNHLVNAYTLTGGVIVINSGLILNTQSESELAAVIAHEIAHVSQRHLARMQEAGKNSPLMTGLGVLAGAAVASQSPDAAQAIVTSTLAMQAHQQIVFTQRAEAEADRVGLRILANAGFNTEAMPYFLEKLERSETNAYGDLTKYLYTHPMSIDRLSDTRSLVTQLPKRKPQDDLAYVVAREKLRLMTGQNATTLMTTQLKPTAQQYAQAYQALRSGNPTPATHLNANTPTLAILQAQALNELKRYAEAEQRLHGFAQQISTQAAFNLALATSQLGQNKTTLGLQTLAKLRLTETTSLEFFEAAQQLAQQAKQAAEASFYNASRSLRLGEYKHALATAEQALALPNTSPVTLAHLRQLQTEAERQLLNAARP